MAKVKATKKAPAKAAAKKTGDAALAKVEASLAKLQ